MRILLPAIVLYLFVTSPAAAQIVNGDFESGATGWTTSGGFSASFPGTGGNPDGYASILSDGGSGSGTVGQHFDCGPGPGDCEISFDYRLTTLLGPGAGEIRILLDLDNNTAGAFPASIPGDWQHATVTTACGPHWIGLQLYIGVDVYQIMQADFDNVSATCVEPLAVEPTTWGRVKLLHP